MLDLKKRKFRKIGEAAANERKQRMIIYRDADQLAFEDNPVDFYHLLCVLFANNV